MDQTSIASSLGACGTNPRTATPTPRRSPTICAALSETATQGVQRALPPGERVREGLEWLKNTMPLGRSGFAATVGLLLLVIWLLVSDADTGRLVTLTIVGLLIYRWVRNRRGRMLRRMVSRVRRMHEVQAIVVRDDLSDAELSATLREPGVVYVRTDLLAP